MPVRGYWQRSLKNIIVDFNFAVWGAIDAGRLSGCRQSMCVIDGQKVLVKGQAVFISCLIFSDFSDQVHFVEYKS